MHTHLKTNTILSFLLLLILITQIATASQLADAPSSYQGRIRPTHVYAQQWLQEIYQKPSIKNIHLNQFPTELATPLQLLWHLHFQGTKAVQNSPLFAIRQSTLKQALSLDPKQEHFSYNQLCKTLTTNSMKSDDKVTANELASLQQKLNSFQLINERPDNSYEKTFLELKGKNLSNQEIAQQLEQQHPLDKRLAQAGTLFRLLPSRKKQGEWLSLHALKTKVYDSTTHSLIPAGNFTRFPDSSFQKIRQAYVKLEQSYVTDIRHIEEQFAELEFLLIEAYRPLIDLPFLQAEGKQLRYPSESQLYAETLYFRYPWIEATIACYLVALLLFLAATTLTSRLLPIAGAVLALGMILHTSLLALRIFILARPPVSNMFETILYVPWIGMILGFVLWSYSRQKLPILTATIASVILLLLLKVTQINIGLENVQAVLDSQYWLIIHVLMVVGSYGAFILCSLLAHQYLYHHLRNHTTKLDELAKAILQTMYIGTALLIPGTILGGIWAAESWGRFWDWDPKESWAFISACTYVAVIHLYRFRVVGDRGLAIGAVAGGLVISFTWYGVNYILGTGLHSYGFGSGGEGYYLAFVAAELLVIASTCILYKKLI